MPIAFDLNRKYVRVIETRADGFVEFEFSIGQPEMAVELILPAAAFAEFCAANRVSLLTGADPGPDDLKPSADDWNWNLRQATHQRFR